jgi:hypothetical protein
LNTTAAKGGVMPLFLFLAGAYVGAKFVLTLLEGD